MRWKQVQRVKVRLAEEIDQTRGWGKVARWPPPRGSCSEPRIRGWENETIRWEGKQRVTVGRGGPRVWLGVAAEKAALTATQFGNGGEQNLETGVYFWHLLSKEHCFSLALCPMVQYTTLPWNCCAPQSQGFPPLLLFHSLKPFTSPTSSHYLSIGPDDNQTGKLLSCQQIPMATESSLKCLDF